MNNFILDMLKYLKNANFRENSSYKNENKKKYLNTHNC